jgi:hypothetical protein
MTTVSCRSTEGPQRISAGRHEPAGTRDVTADHDQQPRRYRRHHDRLRAAWLRGQGQTQLTTEAEDFVEFALKWAPFGGAPAEETFVLFGMTRARFFERLWQLVQDGQISTELSRSLAAAYPPPTWAHRSRTESTPKSSRGSGVSGV